MKITILTLFPEMFVGPFDHSILKNAQEKGLLTIDLINIRDFGIGKHKMVDDTPYGGGTGMILRVDVLAQAIEHAKDASLTKNEEKIVLFSAHGNEFNQEKATEYATLKHLILICAHYEGFDARIRNFIDEELSIGYYITTGGEIPAMLVTDAVSRLIPGVLKPDATQLESFSTHLASTHSSYSLEYPQYTKPREYNNVSIPEVLLSGNHKEIDLWRKQQMTTKKREKK